VAGWDQQKRRVGFVENVVLPFGLSFVDRVCFSCTSPQKDSRLPCNTATTLLLLMSNRLAALEGNVLEDQNVEESHSSRLNYRAVDVIINGRGIDVAIRGRTE
jgi:hypothetical protein